MNASSLVNDRVRVAAALAIGILAGCRGDQTAITQVAPTPLHISFGIKSFGIDLGQYMVLPPIQVVSAKGDSAAAPASLVVVSRNPDIVRIDTSNVVRTVGQGSTWIVASVDTAGQSLRDSLNVVVVCTAELVPVWTPPAKTLAVGESFTPSIVLYGCGGQLTYPDTFTWSASDSTILRVDASTGKTTGLRAGAARVSASGVRFSSVGSIGVTVAAP